MDFSRMKVGVFNFNAAPKQKEEAQELGYSSLIVCKTPLWGKKEGRKTAPDGNPILIEGYVDEAGNGRQCSFQLNRQALELMGITFDDKGRIEGKKYFTIAYMTDEKGQKFADGRVYCTVTSEKVGKASCFINAGKFSFQNDTLHEELRPLFKKWGSDVDARDVYCQINKFMNEAEVEQAGVEYFEITLHYTNDTTPPSDEEQEADANSDVIESAPETVLHSNGFFN